MRAGGGAEGTVLCFTKGDNRSPPSREAFRSSSIPASSVRSVTFATSTRSSRNAGARSSSPAWTDDKFNLCGISCRRTARSHGSDFAGIPRPPASTASSPRKSRTRRSARTSIAASRIPRTVVGSTTTNDEARMAGHQPRAEDEHALREGSKTGASGRLTSTTASSSRWRRMSTGVRPSPLSVSRASRRRTDEDRHRREGRRRPEGCESHGRSDEEREAPRRIPSALVLTDDLIARRFDRNQPSRGRGRRVPSERDESSRAPHRRPRRNPRRLPAACSISAGSSSRRPAARR